MSNIKPHGGVLIRRILGDEEILVLPKDGSSTIEIPDATLVEVWNLAHGCFSPLSGFPNKETFNSILDSWQLPNGTTFPIPPLFPISEELTNTLLNQKGAWGQTILTHNKKPVARIDIEDIFPFNKEKFIHKIFQTNNPEHPGVNYVNQAGDFLVAGQVTLQDSTIFRDMITPEKARQEFGQRGWRTVTAFSTTNVPHRAHEYLQRRAMELTDGVLIHALSLYGGSQAAKYPADLTKKCYHELISNYYPTNKVIFSSLPFLVRSAGPRSSVLQAIVRQNFGCTHQIFGRDHEGFKNVFEKYESQQIFSKFSDLKIQPILMKGPFYCPPCRQISTEDNCKHTEQGVEISGTEIRKRLLLKRDLPTYFLRKGVFDLLREHYLTDQNGSP